MKNFHCCATCKHFNAKKADRGMNYFCRRLGYDTKPNYQFNCWNPREEIKKLINKTKSN